MYKRLRETVDTVAIVDNHAHVGGTLAQDRMDYPAAEKSPTRDAFMTPGMVSFGFPWLRDLHTEAFELGYGFSADEMTDFSKFKELAGRYEIKRLDVVPTTEFFLKAANVEHVLNANYTPEELKTHPAFSFLPLVDPLFFPFGGAGTKPSAMSTPFMRLFQYQLAALREEYSTPLDAGYADYMAFVRTALAGFKADSCVGYKMLAAYVRSLHFPKPDADGETLYNAAKNGNLAAYQKLQDHIAWETVAFAAAEKMPIQIHTALIDESFEDTDPYHFRAFIKDPATKAAKLVLLHAGFPLYDHAKVLAMASGPLSANNVYIDISGRIMFANPPAIIAHMLRDFLEIPALWGKILYGSDTMLGERYLYTCAKTGREAVYLALASLLDDNSIDEESACKIAKGILRNNAIRLYNLGLAEA